MKIMTCKKYDTCLLFSLVQCSLLRDTKCLIFLATEIITVTISNGKERNEVIHCYFPEQGSPHPHETRYQTQHQTDNWATSTPSALQLCFCPRTPDPFAPTGSHPHIWEQNLATCSYYTAKVWAHTSMYTNKGIAQLLILPADQVTVWIL